jgi:hypothetical protein
MRNKIERKKTMPNNTIQDYIGDGVYVEFDGYGIWLRANSPDSPKEVYLEPEVLMALNRFFKRCTAQRNVEGI